jgi:integrase
MDDLVWHDLRRTRVVRLRRRGMPMEMIASITGHSLQAIKEMLKVYGPVDPTITAAAIASTLPVLEQPEQPPQQQEQSA